MANKKLMLAYDGSEHSQRALDWALDLNAQLLYELEIVTVIPPFPSLFADFPTDTYALMEVNQILPWQDGKLGAFHIGFVLGPCLNASGRLDSAQRAMELLDSKTREAAVAQAAKTSGQTKPSPAPRPFA